MNPVDPIAMRDFQSPGRSPAHAVHAMAATSHPLATLTALDVLGRGGNAIDAAVAAVAVLGVVEPHMTGIGGDCFALYAPGGGDKVLAFNGSGCAPAAAECGWFTERGIAAIDSQSPHAVTIPGAVDGWAQLVADHGSKGLDELLQPAIALAEEGYPVHARVAWDWRRHADRVRRDPTAVRTYLPDGKPPEPGSLHRQPQLAETLRIIARDGRDGFYQGPVAEDIVAYLNGLGGLHTLEDFARMKGEYVEPIRIAYRGFEVLECPPNGQGIVALMMLNILSSYEFGALHPLESARLHLEIEAGRLAFRDRDRLVADPASASVPVNELLSADYAAELRGHIDLHRAIGALPASPFPPHPDTVYLCVVDRELNAMSFINSLFDNFGTGLVSPKTGVLLHSRGKGFVVEPGHPNCIGPGKRPMHTIIPGMVLKEGLTVMPFGVIGRHFQPFGHVHLLTNMIDFGLDVQAAIDLARVFYNGEAGVVEIERGIPDAVAEDLTRLGHTVRRAAEPLGGGQAIWIDRERGVLTGGSDPRKDGLALGY